MKVSESPTILIPSYQAPQRALRAAAAAQNGRPVALRTVVVDDGSPGDPWGEVVRPAYLEVRRRPHNGGFAASVNDGLRAITDGDVVLLNSDVVLAPDWLAHVQETASRMPTAVVGIRLHYPGGSLQHAGGVPLHGGWFGHAAEGDCLRPIHRMVFGVPYVTGAFWYWTRAALEDLGGFDEGYRNGVEDVDYCIRAWKRGFAVMYDGRAHGIHECGATRRAAGLAVGIADPENLERFAAAHWANRQAAVPPVTHA